MASLQRTSFIVAGSLLCAAWVGVSGCQLLLSDKSGTGGAAAATGNSTKASTGATTQSSTKATVVASSASGGCTGAACTNDATAMFPQCTGASAACSTGDPRCGAYCKDIQLRCQGGRQQFDSADQCCSFCQFLLKVDSAAMVTDELCCRSVALSQPTLGADGCTWAGALGTIPGSNCGTQADRFCAAAFVQCPPPGTMGCDHAKCIATLNGLGGNDSAYKVGDTTPGVAQAATYLLDALADQSKCSDLIQYVCPPVTTTTSSTTAATTSATTSNTTAASTTSDVGTAVSTAITSVGAGG